MPTAEATANPVDQSITWVSLRRLAAETGISDVRARTMAVAGRIRTRTLPGSKPLYALEDGHAVTRGER